ncbi:DNA translocase FtsK 4TM domain-containing protein, partial [Saccharomonospora iraqiensis]|uniref:DNA translocase FtsK 4TM domain-containing protein n=1 Tax=Saccharomonospora iraqiensis TaxID=52698 RepID=UPI00022E19A2
MASGSVTGKRGSTGSGAGRTSGQRSGGGNASAAKQPARKPPAGKSQGGKAPAKKSPAKKPQAKKPQARKSSGRTPAARRGAQAGGFSGGVVTKAVVRTWRLLALAVGGLARALGRTRELDPEHRRDGLALVLIAFGLVTAVGVVWDSAGPVGEWIATGTRSVLGSGAVVLPFALVAAAVVLMRSEPRAEARPRMVVGTLLVGLAVLGLFHLGSGRPQEHTEQMSAGGWVGWFSGDLLARGVSTWVAVPLLLLLLGYGALVFTGTPIRRIPERLREQSERDREARRASGADGTDGSPGGADGAG